MRYRYLHLIHRRKFIENLQNLIGDRGGHKILVYGDESSEIDGSPVSREKLLQLLDECEVVFVHFLEYYKARLINNLDPPKKIVWFFWGGDGYHLGKFYSKFLLPKTKRLRYRLNFRQFFRGGWKDILKMVMGPLTDYFPPNYQVLRAIEKVDFIVPIIPEDYRNLEEKYGVPCEMFHLNYINDVFVTQPEPSPAVNEGNILLGNSARYSNNHIEFIDRLEQVELGERQVIIPLSYGDHYYGKYVGEYAKRKLGERAWILNTYLPAAEYRRIFDTSDTVVMNHRRQQALGNIVIALWFEKTIYLRSESGLYRHLEELGFHILRVGEFKPGKTLDPEERAANKRLLQTAYAPELQRQRFGRLLALLEDG